MTSALLFPWMRSSALTNLFAAIPDAHHNLRFVGGCVRDSLAGIEVKDIDLATTHTPHQVMEFLQTAGIKVIPTGIEHGTVMAVIDGQSFEITTLRHDVETDGRHAVVHYTDCWQEDAARRDFTFNALYLSSDGTLFDPWNGASDLQEGIVRFIGDPHQRIQEDYLRILRYFRFFARFATQDPTPALLAILKENAHGLDTISGERIRSELIRLLEHPTPLQAIHYMTESAVWDRLFPTHPLPETFQRYLHLENTAQLTPNPLARLYALLWDPAMQLPFLKRRLNFSAKDNKFLQTLLRLQGSEEPLKIILHYDGKTIALAHLLLASARSKDTPPLLSAADLALIQNWQPKKFPLTGENLIQEGYTPGPTLGKELKARERAWVLARQS